MAASDVAAEAAIDAALDRIDEAEEVAHALAQLARADDQDLESFAGLWLDARPIAVGDLRRCRDFMRAMVAAILDQKSDDWARLRLAHASAFPPLEPSCGPRGPTYAPANH